MGISPIATERLATERHSLSQKNHNAFKHVTILMLLLEKI